MKAVIQVKLGMIAVFAGIVGVLLGTGGVEAAQTTEHMIVNIGITVISLIIMWAGVELVRDTE